MANAMTSGFRSAWRQMWLLGEVNLGRFKPGLAKWVRRVVENHLRSNREFQANLYSRLMRLTVWMADHPIRSLFIVLLIYVDVVLFTRRGWLPAFTLANDWEASVRDFWNVNVAVLGVQGALVGLVFPLVIAFVGLLNQGRASFASRLTIYVESSNAIFVGVSSLLLCVAIAVQLACAARMGDAGAAVTLLNLSWFAINACAIVIFVLHTIAFLHPARRAPIIRAYVANIIWPRELTATVTINRWANVVDYGYLPGGDEIGPFAAGGRARTWYSALWDDGEPRVSRQLRRKMQLFDVRFGMLAPVVRWWLAHARAMDDGLAHDFVIPLQPAEAYEGDLVLARATLPLSPVARWAVKASLRFQKARTNGGDIRETSSVLREMIADLIALIDARQADEFGDQLRDVVDFHAFLYRLAQISDEDMSYAQLVSDQGMFSTELGYDWARAYRDLIRRAVERMPHEAEFVGKLAHVPASIYHRLANETTPKALQPILLMGQSLAYRMIDWALGEQDAQAVLDRDAGGNNQEAPAEMAASRRANRVDRLPRDQHRHDGGLARARRHFHGDAHQVRAGLLVGALDVLPQVGISLLGAGDFGQPDNGLNRLDLTEERAQTLDLCAPPVVQQARSCRCDAPIPIAGQRTPSGNVRADFVDDGLGVVFLIGVGQPSCIVEHHRGLGSLA